MLSPGAEECSGKKALYKILILSLGHSSSKQNRMWIKVDIIEDVL